MIDKCSRTQVWKPSCHLKYIREMTSWQCIFILTLMDLRKTGQFWNSLFKLVWSMPTLIFIEYYTSSPFVQHFTNATQHMSRATDHYAPLKKHPADKVVITVYVQPRNCSKNYHSGKSVPEAAAPSDGTTAAALCSAELCKMTQAAQVCSCALPCQVVSEMHRDWHTRLLLSIQKWSAKV